MIKDVKVFSVKGHKTVKANVLFTLDDKFKVKCMVMQGSKGLFVSFPSDKYEKKLEDGSTKTEYAAYFKPISKEAYAEVSQAVLAAFQEATGAQPSSSEPEPQADGDDLVPF